MMTTRNGTSFGTNFTVSIEAAEGVTTGISAADRARTMAGGRGKGRQTRRPGAAGPYLPAARAKGRRADARRPYRSGLRPGRAGGLTPAAVICEIMKDDGTMARLPDLIEFAEQHGLKIGTIADLIHYRSQNESLVERVASAR
jgi:3,4-dihydroxy 2-butanone 4-phosphate synthase/GTP cyclohydrolase II